MLNVVKGFTLLEVLLALFILSVGVLGLGRFQLYLVQQLRDAYWLSAATLQAHNLAERLLVYPPALLTSAPSEPESIAPPNCRVCTPSQMLQRDLFEWHDFNQQILPQSVGRLLPNRQGYRIVIAWLAPENPPCPYPLAGVLENTYTCIDVVFTNV